MVISVAFPGCQGCFIGCQGLPMVFQEHSCSFHGASGVFYLEVLGVFQAVSRVFWGRKEGQRRSRDLQSISEAFQGIQRGFKRFQGYSRAFQGHSRCVSVYFRSISGIFKEFKGCFRSVQGDVRELRKEQLRSKGFQMIPVAFQRCARSLKGLQQRS